MNQTGLVDKFIETIWLDIVTTKGKFTPAKDNPLLEYEYGEPSFRFSGYSSLAGIILYLTGHT